MATSPASIPAERAPVTIRTIGKADLDDALRQGYDDFMAKRGDIVMVGILYPLIGLVAALVTYGNSVLPLLFPLMGGLSIMGPLVSAGFYELARRRETGEDDSWINFFGFWNQSNFWDLLAVGALLIAVFAFWMIAALAIHNAFLGAIGNETPMEFLTEVLTTPAGWGMIVVGNLVGLGFAILVLALSFVSLPMIVDGRAGIGRGLRVSVRAFNRNRVPVLRWGLRVAVIMFLGALPLLLGLVVAIPVLGYATWHLYTKVIDRDSLPVEFGRS